jgi:hypothetical protein
VRLGAAGLRPAATSVSIMGAIALLACLPWMAHAYHLTGDPVFPQLYWWFDTPYWSAFTDQVARGIPQAYGSDWSLRGLVKLPWQLTAHGDLYRTLVGPLFLAFAPLAGLAALVARGPHAAAYRLLALFTVLWTLAWFASGLLVLRYAETVVAGLALLVSAPLLGGRDLRIGPTVLRAGWLAVGLVAVLLNSQLLVPFQRHAQEPLVEGRAAFAWGYLYDGQSARDYLAGWPSLIWYLDDHLQAPGTKVYDDCGLIPYYAYIDVELYNGWNYDSPAHIEGWTLQSADAYQHLKAANVTHVAICSGDAPLLRETPLWQHLDPVPFPSNDGALLYRLN